MAKACILLADGFEEIEATTVIDVLRRADVEVTLLGVGQTRVTGAHGIVYQADASLHDRSQQTWDMVILPGGMPGASTLRDTHTVIDLIQRQASQGRKLAAICAAPIALGKAGVLKGKYATCYPGFEDGLTGVKLSLERVVKDGNIITSRGPGTAMEFALALVRELTDERTETRLRDQMLV